MLTAGPRNRTGPDGPRGLKGPEGPPGIIGPQGTDGDSPEYQWRDTEIRFRKPDGSWGKWVDLRGRRGPSGMAGPPGDTSLASAPKLLATFDTLSSTAIGDSLRVTGTNFVQKITDNSSASIPNGIFGFAYAKPTTTTVDVIFAGILSGFAGFTTGQAMFIQISGVPGHGIPLTGTVQQIGFAVSTTSFFVHLLQAMRRD